MILVSITTIAGFVKVGLGVLIVTLVLEVVLV